jgi:hypothetical protein
MVPRDSPQAHILLSATNHYAKNWEASLGCPRPPGYSLEGRRRASSQSVPDSELRCSACHAQHPPRSSGQSLLAQPFQLESIPEPSERAMILGHGRGEAACRAVRAEAKELDTRTDSPALRSTCCRRAVGTNPPSQACGQPLATAGETSPSTCSASPSAFSLSFSLETPMLARLWRPRQAGTSEQQNDGGLRPRPYRPHPSPRRPASRRYGSARWLAQSCD